MKWIEALKEWNKDKGTWCIPRKGSPEYDQVRALMGPAKTEDKKGLPAPPVRPTDPKTHLGEWKAYFDELEAYYTKYPQARPPPFPYEAPSVLSANYTTLLRAFQDARREYYQKYPAIAPAPSSAPPAPSKTERPKVRSVYIIMNEEADDGNQYVYIQSKAEERRTKYNPKDRFARIPYYVKPKYSQLGYIKDGKFVLKERKKEYMRDNLIGFRDVTNAEYDKINAALEKINT